jgi:hypothetical protein
MAKRGASAKRLKALRKKFKLGEFSRKKASKRRRKRARKVSSFKL